MAVTLALLALHPEEQARAYEAVKLATHNHGDPVFADYNLLLPLQACVYETIRLFPAGYVSIRESSRDEAFIVPGLQSGKEAPISIPSGINVIIDMIGANRNPRHFVSPNDFKPSRWENNMESFLGFSIGPRSCLGRKFATVEAVCFIALVLRDWKVEPLLEGTTIEDWKKKTFEIELGATLTVHAVPLKLTRRSQVYCDDEGR